jgi:hypothetical protein
MQKSIHEESAAFVVDIAVLQQVLAIGTANRTDRHNALD